MILLLGFFFTGYTLGLLWVVVGITKLSSFESKPSENTTKFSILIPFRNEAQYLPNLLKSLEALSYPTECFEILWVNDASEDASEKIVTAFMEHAALQQRLFQNVRYSEAPKKDALTLAVKQATYDWVITTDADCQVPTHWLEVLSGYIQEHRPKMVAGPVAICPREAFLATFQFWDFVSLQAVTWAGFGWQRPLLCNGANLAFEKNAFFEVNGYEGNNQLATGDDLFLMQKMKKHYPMGIQYLKQQDVIVKTAPVTSWKALFQQRIRWASKTRKIDNTSLHLLGIATALGNLGFLMGIASIFIWPLDLLPFLGLLIAKVGIDFLFLVVMGAFFKKSVPLGYLLLSLTLYPFIFVWILWQSMWGHYLWKGRSFKK